MTSLTQIGALPVNKIVQRQGHYTAITTDRNGDWIYAVLSAANPENVLAYEVRQYRNFHTDDDAIFTALIAEWQAA